MPRHASTARGRNRYRVRGALGWLLVIALVAAWWNYLRPDVFGGSTSFVVVTGASMEPTYHTGDLVLVRKQGGYAVGDVVAFRVDPDDARSPLVIHRVIDVNDDGTLVLQGDNNNWVDPWSPAPEDVTGRPFFEARGWGTVLFSLASSPLLLGALLGAFATFLAMLGPSRRRRPPDDDADDDDRSGDHHSERDDAEHAVTGSADAPAATSPPRSSVVARVSLIWAIGALLVGTVGSSALGSSAQLPILGGVIQAFEMPVELVSGEEAMEPQAQLFAADEATEPQAELFSTVQASVPEAAVPQALPSALKAPITRRTMDGRPGPSQPETTEDDGRALGDGSSLAEHDEE